MIKTPETLFLELGADFSTLAIETNQKLILAIEAEEYEKAAVHRDFIQTIINNTVEMSMILLELDEKTIRNSFNNQNAIIYQALLKEYDNNL